MMGRALVPRPLSRNGWTAGHLWGAVALGAIAMAATWPAWVDILSHADARGTGEGGGGRHLWLIPLIAFWLAWVRRRRVLMCKPAGHWIGPGLLSLGAGIYVLGYSWGVQLAWHEGAVLAVIGAVLTMTGRSLLLRFLPAIVVLLFFVPVPGRLNDAVSLPMQLLTARLTVEAYQLVGIPAVFEGPLVIAVGGTEVPVTRVCQGFPIVLDLFLVSYAFVFGMPLRTSVRMVILLLSPVTAGLCAVATLMSTLWLFGRFDPQEAEVLHQLGGWVILSLAFLLLMAVVKALSWASVPVWHYSLAYDY